MDGFIKVIFCKINNSHFTSYSSIQNVTNAKNYYYNPSDLYEECHRYCEKQKISFSQVVGTTLINHFHNDLKNSFTQSDKEIRKIVDYVLFSYLNTLQQRMTDIEKQFSAIQKISINYEEKNFTNEKIRKN